MRSLQLIALVAAFLAVAAIGADARSPVYRHTRADAPIPSPAVNISSIYDPARWAAVRSSLEARNYQRPNVPGALGVDVSSFVSIDQWACVSADWSFAIVRAGCSTCKPDPNGVHTVANAWAGGIQHVDIYLFPAFACSLTAAQQVQQTIAYMGDIPFGTLWLDVEQEGSNWSTDTAANHQWLVDAANAAVSILGQSRVGIYASKWGWVPMGDFADMTKFPLWWARYDSNPTLDNFEPFAGWNRAAMKQYSNSADRGCGVTTDVNFYATG